MQVNKLTLFIKNDCNLPIIIPNIVEPKNNMNKTFFSIGSEPLSIDLLQKIIQENISLKLTDDTRDKIFNCRTFLDNKLSQSDSLYYGINTGFGSLCDVKISKEQTQELQENLVMSHACGIGDEVSIEIIKLMLLLKVQSLSYGYSGVDVSTVWRLIDFYNNEVYPVIYEQGSLGASGDLAPLAHLSLPLLGLGEIYYEGKKYTTTEIFKHFKWNSLKLQSKEGLALLNGTQFMSAYAVHILIRVHQLLEMIDLIAALSCDAFNCKIEPFTTSIHAIRNHSGQVKTAATILKNLEGSEIAISHKTQVQDPYSFRCIPQVHGASKDAIEYVKKVIEIEINSVTDNPNIIVEDDAILSGGNFHGQPLALSLDFLAIAISELGNISERRTYKLISGERGLPPFLSAEAGLHSGMMIPQYTAASIVSQNKQLCTPASVDSIVSSNGQEDHVSMGANAATKCLKVLENTEKIIAIELLNAAQAIEFRRPLRSSSKIEKLLSEYRKHVSFNTKDRVLHDDIKKSIAFIQTYE